MAPIVRADYDNLPKIAGEFDREAERLRRATQQIQRTVEVLQGGDWIGEGASAFYREMSAEVLPAMKRLVSTLEKAGRTTKDVVQIMKDLEAELVRLWAALVAALAGTGARAGAGAGVGASGAGRQGEGGGGSGLPGWLSNVTDALSLGSWSFTGLAALASNAQKTAQRLMGGALPHMVEMFARGGEEALARTGLHELVARYSTDAARAGQHFDTYGKWSNRLNLAGAGFTALTQVDASSAETLAGKLISAGAAGGAAWGSGLSPWTSGLTRHNAYFFAADAAILGVNTVAGTSIDRPTQIVNSAIDNIVTLGEGVATGSTGGMERIHQRNLSGQNGWVFQQAAQAGNFWAEHGVGGGLSMFWDEVTGLF